MNLSLHRWVKSRERRTAAKAYAKAKAAYDDACARKDSRDQNKTLPELVKARTALLQAESVRVVRR